MAEIGMLFSGPAVTCAICMVLGLVFCTAEAFLPGFGVFGITGAALLIFSLVFRVIIGGTLFQFSYLLVMIVVSLTIIILLAVRSSRFGLLSRSAIINNQTAIPKNYGENCYHKLIGKEGITTTLLKPIGKVLFGNEEYQVITEGELVLKGTKVKVTQVDGETIFVKKV